MVPRRKIAKITPKLQKSYAILRFFFATSKWTLSDVAGIHVTGTIAICIQIFNCSGVMATSRFVGILDKSEQMDWLPDSTSVISNERTNKKSIMKLK